MILTLHIHHDGSHRYVARVRNGESVIGASTCHERIDEAISFYGRDGALLFPGVTAFAIWYGGWSVGQVSLPAMRAEASDLAVRLLALSAVLR
ncbi:hypothetical protein [Acidovorax sp.]|uniref:hypothetical protein n=1 Tax=Acidovorax sp. TaxID=1872122 RepID=UPI00391A733E